MRISARIDYGCRALLKLSLHYPREEPYQIQDIAREGDMPLKYTIQILNQLKRIGLVRSIRGRKGGYILAKAPAQISLGKVIREMGGPLLPIVNIPRRTKKSVFMPIWKELENVIAEIVDKITFEDICRKSRKLDKVIHYQI